MDFTSNDFQITDSPTIAQLKELRECQGQYYAEQKRIEREEQMSYRQDLQEILQRFKFNECKGIDTQVHFINPHFKDILMESQWMLEEPKDLDEYLLIPCPKGKRVSITRSEDSKLSQIFFKDGRKFTDLRLNIPKMSQLDGIYSKRTKTVYLLDVIYYDGTDFRHSDTAFRRYWLQSKFHEHKLGVIEDNSDVKFSFLESIEFSQPQKIMECFQTFPLFKDAETDGFLFYHRDNPYVAGKSEKILWLFPYMVDEVLTMFSVNKDYSLSKPQSYTNYMDEIEKFNEKQRKKNKIKASNERKARYQPKTNFLDVIQNEIQKIQDFGPPFNFDQGWFCGNSQNMNYGGGGSRGRGGRRGNRGNGIIHQGFQMARRRAM